jgi:hypothetical protein
MASEITLGKTNANHTIFHSWGHSSRSLDFSSFLPKLTMMIKYVQKKKLESLTLGEAYDLTH